MCEIKKIIRQLLLVLFVGILVNQPFYVHGAEEAQHENIFVDVSKDAYYYDAVSWALKQGITKGVTENTFGVTESCTRGQGLTFIWRAEGSPQSNIKESAFDDVHKGDYFYDAVLWGVENEIANGYQATQFAPEVTLTRAQFITFLYRLMGTVPSSMENPFSDVSQYAYYHDAVLWAVEKGITTGMTDTTFEPDATCLRVQVVTFLKRAYDSLEEEKPDMPDVENPGEEIVPPEDEIGDIVIENPNLPVNAVEYGLSEEDTDGVKNSKVLQALVDTLSTTGGTIYIPRGEYLFAENGSQKIGSHCIKLKSNVSIKGDGEATILKPMGISAAGMDMFYYNEYVDTGRAEYLENCNFEDFVIDGANTTCRYYTSAGKGFMINLFKNCNWKNVVVKNTDATGFGVDSPIGGSMENCTAMNCGKAAKSTSTGAAGFGIGFGYSEDEYFTISGCKSYNNKTYGYFFEHQGRFNQDAYQAICAKGFTVKECMASGNYYNYGGQLAMDTTYTKCVSLNATHHGYFFENSKNCKILNCASNNDANTSFAILQSNVYSNPFEVSTVVFEQCTSTNAQYGAKVIRYDTTEIMANNVIKNCIFLSVKESTIVTEGTMDSLVLTGNATDLNKNSFHANITSFINENNSWNTTPDNQERDILQE